MPDSVQLRLHPSPARATLLYLPGLHGDWTLVGPFRRALGGRARFAEISYPRRVDWRLEDYAAAIEQAALAEGIANVWLLAESFSSQVAWKIVERSAEGSPLRPEGLILAGGFVRHPWPWGVWLARRASHAAPQWLLRTLCGWYGRAACRRCAADAELAGEVAEFVRRRLEPDDRPAITSRYLLIAASDLRSAASRARLPVFHLSGAIDPLVPWWSVRRWLGRHCPSFRASRILSRTGHNHLLDAPQESAEQILKWIQS